MILIDDGNFDAGGRCVPLAAKHHRKNRKKDDWQNERQRLRDPVAAQVDPSNAQQRAHYSRNSLPVR